MDYRIPQLTVGARERIPHFLQELQLAQQRLIEEDVDDEQQPEYQDEWMVLCQRNPRFTVHSEQDDQVDWEAAARDFSKRNTQRVSKLDHFTTPSF